MCEEILAKLPKTAELHNPLSAQTLTRVLRDLGLPGITAQMMPGLRVSLAHLKLPVSSRVREIRSVLEDLMLRLEVPSVRLRTNTRPGWVTLEIAHAGQQPSRVSLGDVLQGPRLSGMALPWAVGMMADGTPMIRDLADAPHVLIGGQTGSGKSSHLHALVSSLGALTTPHEVELIFVDPKQVDLVGFMDLPHVQRGLHTTLGHVKHLVEDLHTEVEFRYEEFARCRAEDLAAYNTWAEQTDGEEPMQRIVVVIDELAMLLSGKEGDEVADRLTSLAQVCRAAGVHLVMSTQRPSASAMPTQLRSQLTTRVACRVATATDSRLILDTAGAELLLGAGDTLIRWGGQDATRVQGTYVSAAWRAWLVDTVFDLWTLDDEPGDEEEVPAEPVADAVSNEPEYRPVMDETLTPAYAQWATESQPWYKRLIPRKGMPL